MQTGGSEGASGLASGDQLSLPASQDLHEKFTKTRQGSTATGGAGGGHAGLDVAACTAQKKVKTPSI